MLKASGSLPSLPSGVLVKTCLRSIAVQGIELCNLEEFPLNGDVMGVVTANGMRVICDLDGDCVESGGRKVDGRDDGGWFSASDD